MPFRKKYWYWNIETHKPEFGRISRTEKLLGPYRSREEAEQAPAIIRERNAQWLRQEQAMARQQARQKAEQRGDDRDARSRGMSSRQDAAHEASASLTPDDNRSGAASLASGGSHPADMSGGPLAQTDSTGSGTSRGTTSHPDTPDASDASAGSTRSQDTDDWPSWNDFLEQPSQAELDREQRAGTGAPPAFFGDTSAIGVVGDDENGTFEQRVARFNKDRDDFEQQSRRDKQERRRRQEEGAEQSRRALRMNQEQAQRLLDEQRQTLPGQVARSLHVWDAAPAGASADTGDVPADTSGNSGSGNRGSASGAGHAGRKTADSADGAGRRM